MNLGRNLQNFLLSKAILLIVIFNMSPLNASPYNLQLPNNISYIKVNYQENTDKSSSPYRFKEYKFINTLKKVREGLFTFYETKHEKLKATYSSGAYSIKYTQNW